MSQEKTLSVSLEECHPRHAAFALFFNEKKLTKRHMFHLVHEYVCKPLGTPSMYALITAYEKKSDFLPRFRDSHRVTDINDPIHIIGFINLMGMYGGEREKRLAEIYCDLICINKRALEKISPGFDAIIFDQHNGKMHQDPMYHRMVRSGIIDEETAASHSQISLEDRLRRGDDFVNFVNKKKWTLESLETRLVSLLSNDSGSLDFKDLCKIAALFSGLSLKPDEIVISVGSTETLQLIVVIYRGMNEFVDAGQRIVAKMLMRQVLSMFDEIMDSCLAPGEVLMHKRVILPSNAEIREYIETELPEEDLDHLEYGALCSKLVMIADDFLESQYAGYWIGYVLDSQFRSDFLQRPTVLNLIEMLQKSQISIQRLFGYHLHRKVVTICRSFWNDEKRMLYEIFLNFRSIFIESNKKLKHLLFNLVLEVQIRELVEMLCGNSHHEFEIETDSAELQGMVNDLNFVKKVLIRPGYVNLSSVSHCVLSCCMKLGHMFLGLTYSSDLEAIYDGIGSACVEFFKFRHFLLDKSVIQNLQKLNDHRLVDICKRQEKGKLNESLRANELLFVSSNTFGGGFAWGASRDSIKARNESDIRNIEIIGSVLVSLLDERSKHLDVYQATKYLVHLSNGNDFKKPALRSLSNDEVLGVDTLAEALDSAWKNVRHACKKVIQTLQEEIKNCEPVPFDFEKEKFKMDQNVTIKHVKASKQVVLDSLHDENQSSDAKAAIETLVEILHEKRIISSPSFTSRFQTSIPAFLQLVTALLSPNQSVRNAGSDAVRILYYEMLLDEQCDDFIEVRAEEREGKDAGVDGDASFYSPPAAGARPVQMP